MKLSEAIYILSPETSKSALYNIQIKEGERAVEEYVIIAQRIASRIVGSFLKDKTSAEKYPELFLNNKIVHNTTIDVPFASKLLANKTCAQTIGKLKIEHSQEEVIDIINGCLELACKAMSIEIRKQKEGKI